MVLVKCTMRGIKEKHNTCCGVESMNLVPSGEGTDRRLKVENCQHVDDNMV